MFPSTHLPSFIQISSAVSEKQGVTKLILDKEEKFLLASALSAIFKVHQNKKKKRSLKSSPLPTYQVSFKYLQPFLRNRCVTHARTHGSTRVKIISCYSFAWQLNKWGKYMYSAESLNLSASPCMNPPLSSHPPDPDASAPAYCTTNILIQVKNFFFLNWEICI
jgi:hypothetical protein